MGSDLVDYNPTCMVQSEKLPDAVPYEPHVGESRPDMRDIILGVNDGLVSIFLLVAGVVGGGLGRDDILLATCAKILFRAHEALTQRAETGSDFSVRRLEMTKNSLVTTYRQVRTRLSRSTPKE